MIGREAALERVEYEDRVSGVKETLGLEETFRRIKEHIKNNRI
ncbi:hypothetical protein PUR_29270 [Paenibacillus sp. URB8-2]|nr:hypothetical protein PUR_29270 [Paenibacillus sp. URB8-2]